MLDIDRFPRPVPSVAAAGPPDDDFARQCREPAELWELLRRRWRPAPPRARLPRVVAV